MKNYDKNDVYYRKGRGREPESYDRNYHNCISINDENDGRPLRIENDDKDLENVNSYL